MLQPALLRSRECHEVIARYDRYERRVNCSIRTSKGIAKGNSLGRHKTWLLRSCVAALPIPVHPPWKGRERVCACARLHSEQTRRMGKDHHHHAPRSDSCWRMSPAFRVPATPAK